MHVVLGDSTSHSGSLETFSHSTFACKDERSEPAGSRARKKSRKIIKTRRKKFIFTIFIPHFPLLRWLNLICIFHYILCRDREERNSTEEFEYLLEMKEKGGVEFDIFFSHFMLYNYFLLGAMEEWLFHLSSLSICYHLSGGTLTN